MSSADNTALRRRVKTIKDLAESDAPDRYVRFGEEVLGQQLTAQQRDLLRSLAENERTVIMSGNGPGKSYGVAIAKLAYLVENVGSTVLGTSGSYSQYTDAVWRPMKALYKEYIMPLDPDFDKPNDSGQPTLDLDDDWFAKVVSPRDPGDLEGRHDANVLVVIEEADKAYIDSEHFDSAGSSVTDGNDRMLVICNPPRDESNAVYEYLEAGRDDDNDRWHALEFSTLESHNVRVDAGEIDGTHIPGITSLDTIRDDWQAWNAEAWPGLEPARAMSDPDSPEFREDLDERWYRRRAGVMPPTRAAAWRPIEKAHVQAAWERDHPQIQLLDAGTVGTGVDVARSGADATVAITASDAAAHVRFEEPGANYTTQRDALAVTFDDDPSHPLAVDAIGEGSGLADMLGELFDGVIRYGNGKEPVDGQTYYSRWEESLALLGDWVANGGSIDDRDLYEELLVASRMVTFEERHYASRGTEVAKATASKADIKESLGRSPDHLDASAQAVWAKDSGAMAQEPSATATLGGDDRGDGPLFEVAREMDRRRRGNKWK